MAEYIEVGQLWKCETCYHNDQYGCTLGLGCDHGENYRPAYGKLKKADVAPVVRCKDCKHSSFVKSCSKYECRKGFGALKYSNDFCSYGERKGE